MHVMQYEIGLPADYDMGIVAARVAARGAATDDFPHLGLKAYAVRTAGRHGSPVNAYAPFYLWCDPAGLDAFLYGPFRAIVRDFGRPAVRHWIGAALHRGPAAGERPVLAVRQVRPLPPEVAPGPVVEEEVRPRPLGEGVHSEVVAVDPDRWEVVRFTLHSRPPELPQEGTAFDLLHVSAPHLDALPEGRLW